VDGTLALEMPFCFPEIDMRALVYDGPRDVSVKKMPDPKIEAPTDVLVRITTTTIR
jgi:glutathione-independent formaldehyde dehydrogenase